MTISEVLASRLWPADGARFSGFQFAYGASGEVLDQGFGGRLAATDKAPLVDAETLFDLASVTKLYTATLAASMHAGGELDLDAPLASWSDAPLNLAELTGRELLTHISGLPPWWEEQSSRAKTIAKLLEQQPDQSQRGQIVYACTGYSLLAILLERKLGKRFDQILSERLLAPLGLSRTRFNAGATSSNIAQAKEPGEQIGFGLVHDPRARALDGVSGNAGLFSNAAEVFSFFSAVLSNKLISDEARRQLFTPTAKGEWQQGIGFRYQDDQRLGTRASFFSHTGFTGTLVMLNPETSQLAVMLTNRLVCGTTREQMAEVYRAFAESLPEAI